MVDGIDTAGLSQGSGACLQAKDVDVFFGDVQGISGVSLGVCAGGILSCIGPAGSGKSVFLRALNRMLDDSAEVHGQILLDGCDVYTEMHPFELRRKVAMIFPRPNTFPASILDNVVFGLRIQGEKRKAFLADAAEQALRKAELWSEVKDRLEKPALRLSEGQQQRLCIARALALKPRILLLDESTSSLDPIASGRIEDMLLRIQQDIGVIFATHTVQQASRVSQNTAFFLNGTLVESGLTEKVFMQPEHEITADYISGRF
jgi:phosphate transport system ATP-binding protein